MNMEKKRTANPKDLPLGIYEENPDPITREREPLIFLKELEGYKDKQAGSGMAFAAKREIANLLLNTEDIIICDPEGDYSPKEKGQK